MSDSAPAAGGGDALSGAQFGDGLTETGDIPVRGGETAQNPQDGLFMYGFYPYSAGIRLRDRARRRKVRKKNR